MKNKKVIIIILCSILVLASAGFLGYIYFSTKNWNNSIYPGIKIQDIDVSGKTKEEAKAIIIKDINNSVNKFSLEIKTPQKSYSMSSDKLNVKYDVDKTIDEAMNYGKNENMFKKYKLIYNSKEKKYDIKINYDFDKLKQLVKIIQNDVDKNAVDAVLSFSNGSFSSTQDTKGKKLDVDKLEKQAEAEINKNLYSKTSIDAPINSVEATVTKAKLDTINAKVSTFSTDYSGSSAERSNNIALATKTISGTVVMPGGEFSFNGKLGKRTAAKGYMSAPVIVGNKVDSDFGGGICQVSTTLYNAVIRADVRNNSRVHHTLPSHYIGLGMDATVDYDSGTDYKFKNTLSYPVYIEGSTANGAITFNIYSNSSLNSKTYNLSNDVYATIEPTTQYVDDASLAQGQTVQDQSASTGYKVRVYFDTYQNGTLLSHEKITDDYYLPVNQIIKRGTKK